jgi:hypothetical protein
MTGLGPSSLEYELLYDNATLDIDLIASDRTAVIIQLLRDFAAHGIQFAYPTQTTFTAAPDGTLVMPYSTQPMVIESDCDNAPRDA